MNRISTLFAAGLAVMAVAVATHAQARCYGYECGPGYRYYGSPRHYGWKPGYPHYNADDYYNQHRQLQGTR
ncbi:MAG TPA: hypothetical protein VKX28_15475 [Xanthobacteraceae bacterium]|nr:hypothetical protein [Xanthobacteraceae bacterium]